MSREYDTVVVTDSPSYNKKRKEKKEEKIQDSSQDDGVNHKGKYFWRERKKTTFFNRMHI